MSITLWQKCVVCLKSELPAQQFNTWIRPIQVRGSENSLQLYAPNRFVQEWVKEHFLPRISEVVKELTAGAPPEILLDVATNSDAGVGMEASSSPMTERSEQSLDRSAARQVIERQPVLAQADEIEEPDTRSSEDLLERALRENSDPVSGSSQKGRNGGLGAGAASRKLTFRGELNKNYTFNSFIQGKSNQIARAAAAQVASNPGGAYNPLFIYGGVGLGKTHLMHAIGNHLMQKNPSAKVVYLHSQTFVGSMVSALQLNAINEFKRYYHSVDALLIDDIQFFANKERSQEEFFHTFNAIFEGGRQIIMTCDKYHSEINGLEERLKSRFGWGLSVAVEPPDLETRAAILMNKAIQDQVVLNDESAMFMAHKLRSNVRELEGALKKVIAHARFLGEEITVPLIRDALKDLLAIQSKLISVDNIQRTVAEYYKIKMADMISKRRNRSVARPRQMAMCLSKELTNHSLPEIGSYYGGRDHTTVLHACRTISDLRKSDVDMEEDYQNLMRSLSS
ncbi:MAG: chromosomal replication initiator protein DnaA [Pseudomonadota bacterium]